MYLNKALQTYLACVAWCGAGRQELMRSGQKSALACVQQDQAASRTMIFCCLSFLVDFHCLKGGEWVWTTDKVFHSVQTSIS